MYNELLRAMKKYIAIVVFLTLAGLGFRLFLALRLPNDEPDDGRLYARIAMNVLVHRSYSIDTEEPYSPTYIRVPGYPLFLAGVYSVFGHDNNRAVRVIQAVLDTATCWLIAWLAIAWAPLAWSGRKRRLLMLIALGAAASCPFSAIYVTTILTEVSTTFLVTTCALTGSLALKSTKLQKSVAWWILAGLAGGLATLFRPDSGLLVAGVGFSLVIIAAYRVARRRSGTSGSSDALGTAPRQMLTRALVSGAILSIGFIVAIGPWTIRNARIFHVFQPIAPAQANMPDEFVPRGYIRWLKTWVDDVKYTETLEWGIDEQPFHIDDVPNYAFDSEQERERVASLFERYNNPDSKTLESASAAPVQPPPTAEAPQQPDSPTEESDQDNNESTDGDEESSEETPEKPPAVEMTPDIDAGFAVLAQERITRHPIRFYVLVPLKRASSLWFDSHSQYYPFQGELLPLSALDTETNQQYFLPAFVFLTWLYTVFAVAGAVIMWLDKSSRRWLLLLALLVIPRMAFLTSMENPEPRYVVEFFAFILPVASISLTQGWDRLQSRLANRQWH
ncbi:MAG TPA: glycosyltransferase family 39 protein [Blastocatellia bacterium]|nr:glycosyltransferase family 39 protein [Blastocatellia bacterium]